MAGTQTGQVAILIIGSQSYILQLAQDAHSGKEQAQERKGKGHPHPPGHDLPESNQAGDEIDQNPSEGYQDSGCLAKIPAEERLSSCEQSEPKGLKPSAKEYGQESMSCKLMEKCTQARSENEHGFGQENPDQHLFGNLFSNHYRSLNLPQGGFAATPPRKDGFTASCHKGGFAATCHRAGDHCRISPRHRDAQRSSSVASFSKTDFPPDCQPRKNQAPGKCRKE